MQTYYILLDYAFLKTTEQIFFFWQQNIFKRTYININLNLWELQDAIDIYY